MKVNSVLLGLALLACIMIATASATPSEEFSLVKKRGLMGWLKNVTSTVAGVVDDAVKTVGNFAVGTYKWAATKVGGVWDALTDMFDDGWLNGLINLLQKIGVWTYQFTIDKLFIMYEDMKTTWNLYSDLKNANFDEVVGHLLEYTRSFATLMGCMGVCSGVIVGILSAFLPFAGTIAGVLGLELVCGTTCNAALAVVEDAATDAYEKATNQTLTET